MRMYSYKITKRSGLTVDIASTLQEALKRAAEYSKYNKGLIRVERWHFMGNVDASFEPIYFSKGEVF